MQALTLVPATAQRITILDSEIKLIPGEAFSRFADSLVYLNITNSQVAEIQAGAFGGLDELIELILSHNNIKLIKSNWIKDLKNLKKLRVWHNQITEIEPEVFDHLPHLEILDIAYNNIDHCISEESLAKLDHLKAIYLSGNPWPLRCRPPVIFHLEHNHVQIVNTWGDSHVLVAECLAHEPHAQWDDEVLIKCVTSLHNTPLFPPVA